MSEIEKVRAALREDLNSVSMIPTGQVVQMVSNGDVSIFYGLICEAIYVRIFRGRDLEDVYQYLTGPMCLDDKTASGLIITALRTRATLVECKGDQEAAFNKILMEDKNASEASVKPVIEACVRTSAEFKIPKNQDFKFLLEEVMNKKGSSKGCCLIFIILGLLLLVLGLLYFFLWR